MAHYKKNYSKGTGGIHPVLCDLSSFSSIAAACDEVKKKCDGLDVIFHNAGIMNFSHKTTADGIEETLQVNLLAPMLIPHFLVDWLA